MSSGMVEYHYNHKDKKWLCKCSKCNYETYSPFDYAAHITRCMPSYQGLNDEEFHSLVLVIKEDIGSLGYPHEIDIRKFGGVEKLGKKEMTFKRGEEVLNRIRKKYENIRDEKT